MLNQAPVIGFIPSRDFKPARAFYEGVLGLRVLSVDAFAMVFDANGTPIRVTLVGKFEPHPFTILGWRVPRIEETVSQLKSKGVRFERFDGLTQDELGIWAAPSGAKVAWFKDPDGNMLSVSQHPE
ncbi:MAG TPA: VOC family protein [Verrucomicrobiae bacterium]|jgi:catechol 2,3-dioxygenase-like lactoylglutathione lyase family enzyme|nr:VOC family protein [Verrucomicrobiae bacterium]